MRSESELFDEINQSRPSLSSASLPKSSSDLTKVQVKTDWVAVVQLAEHRLANGQVLVDRFNEEPDMSPLTLRFNELSMKGGLRSGQIMNLEVRGSDLEALMAPVVRSLGLIHVECRLWIKLVGMVVPAHYDSYDSYRVKHPDLENPVRWIVFPEDQDMGHFFEIERFPIHPWNQGDAIRLDRGLWHSSANSGFRRCLTINITGIEETSAANSPRS